MRGQATLPNLFCGRVGRYWKVPGGTRSGQATLPNVEIWEDACRVLSDSWVSKRGQATLPNLEIGEGACRVLSNLLGNSAGCSSTLPNLFWGRVGS